jgi:hypothetical protein
MEANQKEINNLHGPKLKWEDNIQMNHEDIRLESVDWSSLP